MKTPARRRRRWLWLGVLPALLLLAVVGVRVLLEPSRLSAFLLAQASQATGLSLALATPADVGLWPDLHLALHDLSAAHGPLRVLRVDRVDAVLPWSALWSDTLQIRELRLVAPRVDLPAMQAWLASRPARAGGPALPRIDAAVDIRGAQLAGDGWIVDNLSLQLPALRPGERTELSFAGAFARGAGARATPFEGRLATTPSAQADGLHLDEVHLTLASPAAITAQGAVVLGEPMSAALRGAIEWPTDWPPLPLPRDDGARVVDFVLDHAQGEWRGSLSRDDAGLDFTLRAGDLAAWRADPAAPLLPPLAGSARAERLQFGGVELRGVELKLDEADDVPP